MPGIAPHSQLCPRQKLSGFVADGAARDVADLQDMGFPMVRSATRGTGGAHYRIAGRLSPSRAAASKSDPAIWLWGDEDGVAVTPRERFEELLAAAQKWQSEKRPLIPLIAKPGSYRKAVQEREAGAKR